MYGKLNSRREKVILTKHEVLGRSVQGASHIRSDIECQDCYRKVVCDDGTVILAVADGHGSKSCPYSRTGAKVAVNVFVSLLENLYNGFTDNSEQLLTYLNREGDTRISKAIDTEWKKRIIDVHKRNKRTIFVDDNGIEDLLAVYKQYGTTLLGLLITNSFLFAFQLGDGDICYTHGTSVDMLIEPEKILGVETHSLSKENAWEKAITVVRRISLEGSLPAMFSLSTDGFSNSYKSEIDFTTTLLDYLNALNEHGARVIENNLSTWLSETSSLGCGDDITMLIAYYSHGDVSQSSND